MHGQVCFLQAHHIYDAGVLSTCTSKVVPARRAFTSREGPQACRYFEHQKRFAAMAAAVRLSRALTARIWDASSAACRQVNGIGKLLGDKLVAAGYGHLAAIAAADARVLERIVDKAYPWGGADLFQEGSPWSATKHAWQS